MSDDRPLVFYTNSPIQPGETVLLFGANLTGTKSIHLARVSDLHVIPDSPPIDGLTVGPLQVFDSSVKFILPVTVTVGMFALWIQTDKSISAPVLLNRADLWWCQGNTGVWRCQGNTGVGASPGGWLRFFGRCLHWNGGPTKVMLQGTTGTITLEATEANEYAAKAELPNDLPSGDYDVVVHNGSGGEHGWSTSNTIRVDRLQQWPDTIFNVQTVSASEDDQSDDTARIQFALNQLRPSKGKTVIYFTRGTYRLSDTLTLPPDTVLRGERTDLVHLVWTNPATYKDPLNKRKRLDAVIIGKDRFGLEDLTLTFAGANNGIVGNVPRNGAVEVPLCKQGQSSGIFLRRVTMRWLLYSGDLPLQSISQVMLETMKDSGYGANGFLLAFGGDNIQICDCDLYSSGNLFNLVDTTGALIAGNRFSIGRGGWANFDGCSGVICENNVFVGADNMARTGVAFWSHLPMRNVYFDGNEISDIFLNDREGMTTDGRDGAYFGEIVNAGTAIDNATEKDCVTLQNAIPKTDYDRLCYILSGTGQGQWRTVTHQDGPTLKLDRDWDVLPQAGSSIVGVNHLVEHFLITRNTMRDVGIGFQFYGAAMNSIVAGNRCTRAGGLLSLATRYPSDSHERKDNQPQFFIQYLDNIVDEGNTPNKDNRMYNSVVGITASSKDGKDRTWPLALGFVFRGNNLHSFACIRLDTPEDTSDTSLIKDVIIEKNTVSCTKVGIGVGYLAEGVVIRHNQYDNVPDPRMISPGAKEVCVVEDPLKSGNQPQRGNRSPNECGHPI